MEESTSFEQQASVVSWGRSDFGGLLRQQEEDIIDGITHFQLSAGRTIVAISSNIYHTAAVSATGEVYTTGCNTQGQVVENTDIEQVDKPRIVESLNNHRIVSVSCGLNHTVCVTASGCAISFGGNESGQLGHSAQKLSHVPPKVVNFILTAHKMPLIVTKVSCGDLFTLFLTTTGEVYGCGAASYLGRTQPQQQIVSQAERVEAFVGSNVIDITAGAAHSLALVASGELYGWGSNSHYQLGFEQQPMTAAKKAREEDLDHQQTPKLIPLPKEIGQVIGMAAGYSHSLIWTSNGYLLGAGSNKYGQLGLNLPRADCFERIPLPYACTMAACGLNHSVVLCDSSLHTLEGSSATVNSSGAATSTSSSLGMNIEQRVSFAAGAPITRVPSFATATASAEASLMSTAKVFSFGYNNFNQATTTSTVNMVRSPNEVKELSSVWSLGKVLYVAAGGDHSFAIGLLRHSNDQSQPLRYDQMTSSPPQAFLRKKFSTLASKAVVAMSTEQLLRLINRAAEDGSEEPRIIGDCLSTINEIFSSPSLLAGSFLSTTPPAALPKGGDKAASTLLPSLTSIDVEGLEACYSALVRLNHNAIARLLGAIQQSLTELEKASSNTSTLPETAIRVFLILLQAPIFADPVISADLMQRLVTLISKQNKLFIEALSIVAYAPHIFATRLVKPIIEHLNYHVQSEKRNITQGSQGQRYDTNSPKVMQLLCRVASWLFAANQRKGFLVPVEQFYSKELSSLPDGLLVMDYIHWRDYRFAVSRNTTATADNSKTGTNAAAHSAFHNTSMEAVDPVTDREQTRFLICDFPYLLSAEGKRRIVLGEAAMQQQQAQRQAVTQGILGGSGYIMPFFLIPVERNHLLQQTLLHIANASQLDLKKPLKVIFINEEGVDEGGVKKEFFQLLTVQLFDLLFGMFTPTVTGRHIWFNSGNTWSVDEYRLVGSILALAVYNNVLLDVHLPSVFYKKLLQIPLNLEDVERLDPELYRGMKQLLEFEPAELVEDTFCRNFTAEYEAFGEKVTVDLVENGANINVTGNNRKLFVDKYVQWLLVDNIQTQFTALSEGFSKLLPAHQLLLFTPGELELLMVGMPHLDFKELEQHTEYIGDTEWNKDNQAIRWFWQTVHEVLSFDEKQKLLKFITGSNKAPIGGLKDIGLKIQRMGPDSNNLPTSHTCFNTLLLPQYDSPEKLRDRLLKAINECEGFGLK